MKLFINDIKNIDWLHQLLQESERGRLFLSCTNSSSFVFFYDNLNPTSEIQIKGATKVFEVNELIFRAQSTINAQYTGVLREPFDTQNFLFYAFLKAVTSDSISIITASEKLDGLFLFYKAQDLKNLNIEERLRVKYSYEISNSSSFRDAMASYLFITPKLVNGMCLIGDMINTSYQQRTGIPFYGGYLKEIVTSLPNPDGGLIPQYGGMMRYMIVGEKIIKNESLKLAKEMLRANFKNEEIYLKTRWFFNNWDNKWRYKLPTESFRYKPDALTEVVYLNVKYYVCVPKRYEGNLQNLVKELLELNQQNAGSLYATNMMMRGYNITLGDIFIYPELFELYPEIKDRVCFYLVSHGQYFNDVCFASKGSPTYISLMSPHYTTETMLPVGAHEMQHLVQDIEGFANGGNTFLANLISSIGGERFRDYFSSLMGFIKLIETKASLVAKSKYMELYEQMKSVPQPEERVIEISEGRLIKVGVNIEQLYMLADSLKDAVDNSKELNDAGETVGLILVSAVSSFPETSKMVSDFIIQNFGQDYQTFFNVLSVVNIEMIKRSQILATKGWTRADISILNFRAYLYLAGELESRYVQQTLKLNEQLSDYFLLYTSETINPKEVNVYGHEIAGGTTADRYGLETTSDNKYVLHTAKRKENIPFIIHEMAHALYDIVKDRYADLLQIASGEANNIQEAFCESFVDYVAKKEFAPEITEHIKNNRGIFDTGMYDMIFDELFNPEPKEIEEEKLTAMYNFVQQLLDNQAA